MKRKTLILLELHKVDEAGNAVDDQGDPRENADGLANKTRIEEEDNAQHQDDSRHDRAEPPAFHTVLQQHNGTEQINDPAEDHDKPYHGGKILADQGKVCKNKNGQHDQDDTEYEIGRKKLLVVLVQDGDKT